LKTKQAKHINKVNNAHIFTQKLSETQGGRAVDINKELLNSRLALPEYLKFFHCRLSRRNIPHLYAFCLTSGKAEGWSTVLKK